VTDPSPLVSVIVPAFNEERTIAELLRRVWEQPFDKEIVVVDDGSRDGTAAAADAFGVEHAGVRVFRVPINAGKGAAVRLGFAMARGEILAVQDADLELDPADLTRLVRRFEDPAVQVVYGSRFLAGTHRCTPLQRLANGALTLLTVCLYGSVLTDMETCYKLVRRDVLDAIRLEGSRFEFEPEITAKLLRLGATIVEEPIAYQARDRGEGKKIGWRDGVEAVKTLIRWRCAPRATFLKW
jgi:glycosyltransferase involved in cell wall biosynthesis